MHACKGLRRSSRRPIGFNIECAGRHGQAFGNGLYFGLSDHATVGYNQSANSNGSACLALLLTHEKIGWQHHHTADTRPATTRRPPRKDDHILHAGRGADNAIVHEPVLVLPIGLVRAFDPKKGWVTNKDAYGLA